MNQNPLEKGPEKILTKEEVLRVISRFLENSTVTRELSDDKGLYLLETQVAEEEQKEIIEYQYMRKGRFGKNQSSDTSIYIVYYQNGVPTGGNIVAIYNPKTEEWKDIR
ncbi:MAG: hypothetical protein UR62_C0003G0021 [Candidatus Nomurabacteria bacterium GW2011_GWF2_35_12]|uniref:Uncharacterized protein n=2 Tax=Candidatus Nomuraibacteriota TaxID=1752729 RepID=A0A0G0E9R1_9BACT|nr:MAG: hypothetical protein UR62_C0003G0021 [Candidatus Nomurabacteria bacterium GW2011_GWF2_35_12]KKP71984.1 MAG: hypothetical protein UR70_C0015G0013 [Candidatus Nomurabacteria bacterium GW2011_GWB1_35_20]KKP76697.1 MAG: hypothetical protein UR72_C0001G0142 [Parcubacteria group bacterium GW2011_GWC1_35_21]KKP78414.1 MAG: hypothetical protein UR77_C0003G0021 [Candidatus Nomurabacteria bacterium GW2011_GWC2_35_35]KKP85408.1 MAG: hypothetical protein UR86_C0004G0010 [Parcubacteria group bacteri